MAVKYVVKETESFELAISQLIRQFIKENPSIGGYQATAKDDAWKFKLTVKSEEELAKIRARALKKKVKP